MEDAILIYNYLDGTATKIERKAVEDRLFHDESFAKLFSELKNTDILMANEPLKTAPDRLTNAIMKEISPIVYPQLKSKLFTISLLAIVMSLGIVYSLIQLNYINTESFERYIKWIIPTILLCFSFLLIDYFLIHQDKKQLNH